MQTQKGIRLPDDLVHALETDPQLLPVLERMRPSCQRDYVAWIDEAAQSDMRAKRIDRVVEKIVRWGKRHQLLVSEN